MAISSPGIGSGLDINSIVSQLVALERKPIQQLQTQTTSLQTKVSAYGRVKSELAALQDAAAKVLNASTWTTRSFTSSNTSALTGSATDAALAGSFSVQVGKLAQPQVVASGAIAAGSAIGVAGTLQIQSGTWTGTSFDGGSNTVTSIPVSDTDTLTTIASKINAAGAGVSAIVVTSGGNQQLLLRGQNTGTAQGFEITALDDQGSPVTDANSGLGRLAYAELESVTDPDTGNPVLVGVGGPTDRRTQVSQDAEFSLDGVKLTSGSNTVTGVVPGLTLNLLTTTTSNPVPDPTSTSISVGVNVDKTVTKDAIEAFRVAFNRIAATLAELTRADGSGNNGALQGDQSAVGLQNMLRNLVGSAGPTGTGYSRLSDMGLQLQRNGSLTVNSSKLEVALNNPSNLRTFLAGISDGSSGDGIVRRIRDFAMGANGVQGTVTGRSQALQAAIKRKNTEIDRVTERVARSEERLLAQYSRLDASLGSLNSLSSYVSQQLAQWNKS